MKRLLMAVAALAIAGVAFAGPNAGGTIFLHDANAVYTTDTASYCGVGAAPAGCEGADVQIDGSDNVAMVFKVFAAFVPGSSPRLKALAFGITYDASVSVGAFGPCAEFELAGTGWPGSGTGTSIVWDNAQTAEMVEAYWFAGYSYYGAPAILALGPNPDQGGNFADDSVPSILDEIAGYGTLGFNQAGAPACPQAPAEGACCLQDGTCILTLPADCQGQFLGGPCDPNPCPQDGACCLPTGECVLTHPDQCPGDFVGGPCDPNPCDVIPTLESSWGQIKNNYR